MWGLGGVSREQVLRDVVQVYPPRDDDWVQDLGGVKVLPGLGDVEQVQGLGNDERVPDGY